MGLFDFIGKIRKRRAENKLREQVELARIEHDFPSIFKKKQVIYSKIYHSKCQFKGCDEKISTLTRYECPYCHKQFCERHRLPENHNCKNPKLPDYMKRTGQKFYAEENKEGKFKEIN